MDAEERRAVLASMNIRIEYVDKASRLFISRRLQKKARNYLSKLKKKAKRLQRSVVL